MPYRDLEPVSKQLTIVVGLTVVGFMTFGLALSFYRNVLFQQTLLGMRTSNDHQRYQNMQSQSDLEYYRSVQFKDKYAKGTLGKANPGEHVLILSSAATVIDSSAEDSAIAHEQRQAAYDQMLKQMPVIEHWDLYLFHTDKLEELKHSFLLSHGA